MGHKALLFNCTVYLVDSRTDSPFIPSLDIYDDPLSEIAPQAPEAHTLGLSLHYLLRQSPALSTGTIYETAYGKETFRDFSPTLGFSYGVSRKNQSTSELWLSAYIGNYIGNCLSFLNDFLQLVEIEPEAQRIDTKLFVKWERVAATLGGLAVFQVLSSVAALLYCRQHFEMIDDVSTFLSMFIGIPVHTEDRRQEDVVYQGRFVAEGSGFRWVFPAGAGRDVKVGTAKDIKVS